MSEYRFRLFMTLVIFFGDLNQPFQHFQESTLHVMPFKYSILDDRNLELSRHIHLLNITTISVFPKKSWL